MYQNLVKQIYLLGFVMLVMYCNSVEALEISVNLSTGGSTQNKAIWGTTTDGSGNVTAWGSNIRDYVVKFTSNAGSTVNINDFRIQLTANPGQNVGTNNLYVTWFNWVDSTSQTNPSWSSRVGSLGTPATSFSGFGDVLIGPGTFSPSAIPVLTTGSTYFFRIWSNGSSSNSGYGVKLLTNNIDLQYNVTSSTVDTYNYNGTTFSTTPASTFTVVPEPSTYLLVAISIIILGVLKLKRPKSVLA